MTIVVGLKASGPVTETSLNDGNCGRNEIAGARIINGSAISIETVPWYVSFLMDLMVT